MFKTVIIISVFRAKIKWESLSANSEKEEESDT
jgi:hypothetical protein